MLEVVENLVAIGIVDDRLDEFFGNSFVKSGDKVIAVHKIDGLTLNCAFFNLAGEMFAYSDSNAALLVESFLGELYFFISEYLGLPGTVPLDHK